MPKIRPSPIPVLQQANAGQAVAVGTSPFVYTATQPSLAQVVGGVVTLIERSMDNGTTWLSVGILAGEFILPAGAQLRVTAPVTKPTLTVYPL
ncbi:hypothetical protein [Burkholderia gladioli]|uniref:hypothetical protein n=1 Tax=Burkholderia gladioli TaxID=28095 RepID=UPI001641F28A|nr:hypothetical protein [Burkholderia gladioli]